FTTKRSTTRPASLPKRSGRPVYFDNTAGAISDAVLPQLAMGARVVICGTASGASWDLPTTGPRVERHLLVKRADVRIPGIRLSAPLRGSGGAARRPGARRQPALSRGHRRRHRTLPRRHRRALPRRKPRRAAYSLAPGNLKAKAGRADSICSRRPLQFVERDRQVAHALAGGVVDRVGDLRGDAD